MTWLTLGQISIDDGLQDVVLGTAQYGLIPAAAVAAYRLSSRAYTEAATVAKETAKSYRDQLATERTHFASVIEVKDQRIRELENALMLTKYPKQEPKKESE